MNFPTVGHYFLLFALACAIANIGLTAWAFRRPEPSRARFLGWAHEAAQNSWLGLLGASIVLIYLFLTDDFSVNYVWGHSSKAQPLPFKIAAFWGGQAGSLLMWAGVLGTYTLLVSRWGRKHKIEIAPASVAVLSFVNVFFIGLVILQANPFTLVGGETPTDGFGLNPLLQNYWMQIHPPILYAGYIGCSVPFALGLAALLHRRFDSEWVKLARRWTLFTWIVLFIGIVLGGVWAYETLGWGGYWAWDPVENASLMPWLVLTAFLHSIMLQERRGLLKNWNITLVSLTFLLSIFGTFLTRSGIVSSVHSFAESDIGNYFLAFLGLSFLITFGIIFYRRDELSTPAHIESSYSREGAILAANWLWLAAAFTVLFGTIWPVLTEAWLGSPTIVEQKFFNQTVAPIGLLILALAGVGPLLNWTKTSPLQMIRAIKKPLWIMAFSVLFFVGPLLYFLGNWHTGAATAFLLCAFLVAAMGQELWRGAQAGTLWKTRRRTGGYIVHLGLALFYIGLASSTIFKIEKEPKDMKVGDTLPIGEYLLRFDGFLRPQVMAPEKQSDVAAKISVLKDGQIVAVMTPNVDIYKAAGATEAEAMAGQGEQTARRPAIRSTMGHDLYLALIGYDMEVGVATIKAYLNPLVMWIWISIGFFVFGSFIALLPDGKKSLPQVKPLSAEYSGGGANGNGNGVHPASNGVLARADLEAEIEIAVAREKLKLGGSKVAFVEARSRAELESEIEIAVAREKLKLSAQSASTWRCACGREMSAEDKFCASCGAPKDAQTVEPRA